MIRNQLVQSLREPLVVFEGLDLGDGRERGEGGLVQVVDLCNVRVATNDEGQGAVCKDLFLGEEGVSRLETQVQADQDLI